MDKEDKKLIKRTVIWGSLIALFIYMLGKKGKSLSAGETPSSKKNNSKPTPPVPVTYTKTKEKPKTVPAVLLPDLSLYGVDLKIEGKELQLVNNITFYFMDSEDNPDNIFLFLVKVSYSTETKYYRIFYPIGAMKELKSRKKLKTFIEANKTTIDQINWLLERKKTESSINMYIKYVYDNNSMLGTSYKFKGVIKHIFEIFSVDDNSYTYKTALGNTITKNLGKLVIDYWDLKNIEKNAFYYFRNKGY